MYSLAAICRAGQEAAEQGFVLPTPGSSPVKDAQPPSQVSEDIGMLIWPDGNHCCPNVLHCSLLCRYQPC